MFSPILPADAYRRPPVLVVALCMLISACGTGQTDSDQEAGAQAEDDTRVELIFVDSDSASATDPSETGIDAPAGTSPAPPPAPTVADEAGGDELIRFAAEGPFAVQVATFKNAAAARRRVGELEKLGYPAYATAHPTSDQVRVRIGYFSGRQEADRFGQRFCRDHGGSYWVDLRVSAEAAAK